MVCFEFPGRYLSHRRLLTNIYQIHSYLKEDKQEKPDRESPEIYCLENKRIGRSLGNSEANFTETRPRKQEGMEKQLTS